MTNFGLISLIFFIILGTIFLGIFSIPSEMPVKEFILGLILLAKYVTNDESIPPLKSVPTLTSLIKQFLTASKILNFNSFFKKELFFFDKNKLKFLEIRSDGWKYSLINNFLVFKLYLR